MNRRTAEKTVIPVEVGPARGQPDQPERPGERGTPPRGEVGGDAAASTRGDGIRVKANEGSTSAGSWFKCGEKVPKGRKLHVELLMPTPLHRKRL